MSMICYHIGPEHRVLIVSKGDCTLPYPFTAYLQSLSEGSWVDRGFEHVKCYKEALDELERIVEHDCWKGATIEIV